MNRLLRPGVRTQVFLVLLLSLAAWSGSLVRSGFALDDREIIEGNPVVEGSVVWTRAIVQDYWHHRGDAGHWRPAATLSLRIDHLLYGLEPLGFHVTNLILHLMVVALGAILILLLLPNAERSRWPWFGLAVFAAHPALGDSVAWMSGRTSMLSALGGLVGAVGLASIVRRNPTRRAKIMGPVWVIAAAGTFLALMGKEDGVVFIPLMALIAMRISKRATLASLAGSLAAVLLWLWLRRIALGTWIPSAPEAPLAGVPLFDRMAISGRALVQALRITAFPVDYPPNYRAQDLGLATTGATVISVLGWTLLGLALVLGPIALLLGRGSKRLVGASIFLSGLAILPVMQLIPAGEVFAPRFLYLPLLLGVPFVGHYWRTLFRRPSTHFAWAAFALAACVPLAWDRAGVYRDRGSYWSEVLAHHPDDPRAWNAVGNAHKEADDVEAARAAWEQATRLDPNYSRPLANLGGSYAREGRLEEAETVLRQAVARGSGNAIAHMNLGTVLLRQERPLEAVPLYERATDIAPGMSAAWRGLGRARLEAGLYPEAKEALERALKLNPDDALSKKLLEDRLD